MHYSTFHRRLISLDPCSKTISGSTLLCNDHQGQSLDIVGVDLRNPVFTHGQLYVALSRATNVENLSFLLPHERGGMTENIVYPEVLLEDPDHPFS